MDDFAGGRMWVRWGFLDNLPPQISLVVLLNSGTGPDQYAGGGALCANCFSVTAP